MFARLPRELRDMIWFEAAAIQLQEIADGVTKCSSPGAERQRQALVGYDDIPSHTEKDALRVYVQRSRNGDKLRISVNEFQTLVNRLPMATVCTEARSAALEACRAKVQMMNIIYSIEITPEVTEDFSDSLQKPISPQPTTVVVTNMIMAHPQPPEHCPPGFDSAEHVVDIVSRVFGSGVTRITLNPWAHSHHEDLESIYWPHTEKTRSLERWRPTSTYDADRIYDLDVEQPPTIAYMTPDRHLHIQHTYYTEWEYDVDMLCYHLLKFYEILDASKPKLPRLQNISLEHYEDGGVHMSIMATYRDGALRIDWDDLGPSYFYNFGYVY
ncbi:hypothetical protein P171DRAFT_430148 [Karstenula rhodostoma CBS 690.94]|uniref:2EXR domain-containing protein n=1 Tax=Karstenula rhodostoma CBS 690.94 TaxID=1392251 RepID=A0A9P4PQN4_9PLEO|nr:hypothetical protein P171DRAFT_430148 [Karstenula rhodostoma CBS 690.94]